jgi:hypothetical protein
VLTFATKLYAFQHFQFVPISMIRCIATSLKWAALLLILSPILPVVALMYLCRHLSAVLTSPNRVATLIVGL